MRDFFLKGCLSFHKFLCLSLVFVFGSVLGCGGSDAPTPTKRDEVQAYLDAHPELKEPKEEVDNTVLTGE